MSRRLRNATETLALRVLFAAGRAVSLPTGLRLGRGLGDLLYDIVRIRRGVALRNLRDSFPEKTEREISRIARACYRNFATTALLFSRQVSMSREDLLRMADVDGLEHVADVASRGKGTILLTGHFGNWEWLGCFLVASGFPTSVVAGRQRNPGVEALLAEVRTRSGLRVLSAERDLRGMLDVLREGGSLAIVGDQDAGGDGIFVEFLGRPASTAQGPVRLARRFGVPILIGFGRNAPDGRLRIRFHPPIDVPRDGEEEEILRLYTERWSRVLEAEIRRAPEHWFWMHRRWKTRPPSAAVEGKGGSGCG